MRHHLDFDGCSCSGKSLSRLLQPAVMAVLAEEPLHGYAIARRLEEMAPFRDPPPDPTGLYRLLKNMEEDGLVVSNWDLADSGPAKRLFSLTADGRECLRLWAQTLQRYHADIQSLLTLIQSTPATDMKKQCACKKAKR